jgi:hypothetical protein
MIMAVGNTTQDPNIDDGGGRSSNGPHRPTSTPPGFRNLRVLIPEELHWKLRNLALESRMTFQRYIVSWLGEAFPLNGNSQSPESLKDQRAAHAPGLAGPVQSGQADAKGLSAAQNP